MANRQNGSEIRPSRVPLLACALLLPCLAAGQQATDATVASMPDTQPPLAEDADLLQLRCASLLDAVEAVRDAQMPKGGETGAATAATGAAAAAMDAPAPDAAQDALVDVMLWTNGYLNGRAGGDRNGVPLTRRWMADNVRALAERCAEDEERYVTDVVRSM